MATLTIPSTSYTDAEAIAAVEGEATLELTGVVSVAGQLLAADGTNVAPSISFTNLTDAGMYKSPVSNRIAWATSGAEQMNLDSASLRSLSAFRWKLAFGTSGDSNPNYTFGGDENTGMRRFAADILSFSAGGVRAMQIRKTQVRIEIATTIIGNNVTPAATCHIDQKSTTGAIPVLLLDQADVSEEFIKFVGAAAAADVTQSIVDNGDVATATLAGWIRVEVEDVGNQITDQAYYQPLYTLT